MFDGNQLEQKLNGTEAEKKDFLSQNLEKIRKYLDDLDLGSSNINNPDKSDNNLSYEDIGVQNIDEKALKKLLKTVGLDKSVLNGEGIAIDKIVKKINEYIKIKEKNQKETITETRQLKSDIKKSQSKEKRNNNSISEEVLKNKGYIIQKNDWLSVVTKGIDINFNEKANLIYPGDIVKIEKGDLIITRIKTGKKEVVGTLIGYNITKTPLNRSQGIDSGVIVPGIENPKVKEKTEKELQKKIEEEEKAREDEESSLWEKEILSDFKWESDIQEFDLENLGTFFNIDLSNLNNKIKENGLDLDLVQFLSKYELYIETNLSKFEYKDKIIESISKKIQKLEEIIDKRIAWVDEQIGEGDYDEENRQKEIQNQRWIINSHIQELFSDINNKALPSAYLIVNKKSDIGDSSERTNMFSAKLTEDGDFDKSIWTGEAYDALTDNWNTLDASDENDRKILDKAGVKIIDSPSILSPEDIEREKKVESYYIGYVLISMLPYLGAGLALPSDIADLVSDEEGVSKVLRTMGVIDENYRMEKSYWDNILGGVGIVLSVFGLQALARAKKGAKAFSLAKGFTTSEIKKSISELGKLMNLPKEQIDKTLSFLKKENKVGENTTPVEFYVNPKTGTTYRKTLDGKFINSKGVELKNKPKNIEKVEISEKPKDTKIPKETNNNSISSEEFEKFTKTGEVSDDILDSIAMKIKEGKKLSDRENAIRIEKNQKIEKKLQSFQKSDNSDKIKKTGKVEISKENKPKILDDLKNSIDTEIGKIEKGGNINIGSFQIERSLDGKKYKISLDGEELEKGIEKNKVSKLIINKLDDNQKILDFSKKIADKKIEKKSEFLKGKKISDDLYFSKEGKFDLIDNFGKKIEFKDLEVEKQNLVLEKITGENILEKIKYNFFELRSNLTDKGKSKLESKGGVKGYIKESFANYWGYLKGGEGKNFMNKPVVNSLMLLPRTVIYGGKKSLNNLVAKPIIGATEAYNPKNLKGPLLSGKLKEDAIKIYAGAFATSSAFELYQYGVNENEQEFSERVGDVLYNTVIYGTGGVYIGILASSTIDTTVGYLRGMEQRDFIPSFSHNLIANTGLGIIEDTEYAISK